MVQAAEREQNYFCCTMKSIFNHMSSDFIVCICQGTAYRVSWNKEYRQIRVMKTNLMHNLGRFHHFIVHEGPQGEYRYRSTLFLTSALEGGEGSASRPGRTLPPGKTRDPLYRRSGGHHSRSGQVRKISLLTGIRSPYRPARRQSLYRLRYPAHMHNLSSVYFVIQLLHVSGIFLAHHQEV